MKTPREILLARHQAAARKLDEIRRNAVAELNDEVFGLRREAKRHADFAPESHVAKAAASLRFATAFQMIWRELIWSCRRTWAGLAAAWLAIAVFNHSQTDRSQIITAQSSTPPGEVRLAFQEQRRVLEELIGPMLPSSPAEPPRRQNNQPRSERRSVAMA